MIATIVSGTIATTKGATNPKVSAVVVVVVGLAFVYIVEIVIVVVVPAELAIKPATTATNPLPNVE